MSDDAQKTRPHPVQAEPPGRIDPAVTARAYEVYAHVYGTSQSLDRLSQRGGFSWGELAMFLYARSFPREEWRARVHEARDPT